MFDDDLATMYADTLITVPASIGTSSTRGMFGWEDVLEQHPVGGFVTTSRQVLTIVAGALPASKLVFDATIIIDGATYRVRDVRHITEHQVKVVVAS